MEDRKFNIEMTESEANTFYRTIINELLDSINPRVTEIDKLLGFTDDEDKKFPISVLENSRDLISEANELLEKVINTVNVEWIND